MPSIIQSLPGVFLCGLLLSAPALAQSTAEPKTNPAPEPTNIKVQVNEVIVPVTVTDERGRFVSNLVASDFHIFDEGRPQRISFFSHNEKQPVVVGFLLDMSNNTRSHWKTYQDAIMELVWRLLPGDKQYSGYLISYSNDAELLVNTTSDSDKIVSKIRNMKPGGGAALYDAIYMACTTRELVKGEPYQPRRIIIVVGDGHDTASTKTLDQVLELAQRNLVTIYGMSTMAYGFNNESQSVLERLTHETGGHVEYPLNTLYKDVSGYLSTPSDEGNYAYKVGTGGYAGEISSNIWKAVTGIADEVTTQYILRYTPDVGVETKPRDFRSIRVDVDLPDVKVRARKGYYPMPVSASVPSGQ
ncbi:MAG TPA: VWA domain-containing protein [Bryobacteraceae bacterium]|nr:VWA domain-containing protein [Bryobacteraceae bacterium]